MAGLPKGMMFSGYDRDPATVLSAGAIQPSYAPMELPQTPQIRPHAFDATGTGTRAINGLGAFATTLAALRGNQGASQLLAQEQRDQELALQGRRLDAQNAQAQARLNKPQVQIGADGRVISVDPLTGAVSILAEGTPKPTALQQNADYLGTIDPSLRQTYLRSQANPMTLMTDPSTGAVGFYPRGGPTPSAPAGPPEGAVSMLRSNPSLSAQFDAKYGAGASARYLGGAGPAAPRTFP